MKRQYKSFVALLFVASHLLSAPLSAESSEDIIVFVNRASPVDNLTMAEVKQIFLKEKTKWPTGASIICINPPKTSLVRYQFRKSILQMTEEKEDAYWQDKKIRNNLSTPVIFLNTARAVFHLPKGISYAFRKDIPLTVIKVVLVIPANTI
jgi:ABC-type phosphate transport system substrate-binding protein